MEVILSLFSHRRRRHTLLSPSRMSRAVYPSDKSNRSIFGDAAAACLISENGIAEIGSSVLGTDGCGAEKLILKTGAARQKNQTGLFSEDDEGHVRYDDYLYMDGGGIFNFVIPNDLSTGQYEIRLCCAVTDTVLSDGECRYVNSSNTLEGTWFALPQHCVQMFTVKNGSEGGGGTSTDYYDYLGIDFYDAEYEYNALNLSSISFTNYVVINSSTNKTFNLYIEYWYDNAPTPVKLGTASRTLNINDMPWATINMHYKDNITTITDANLEDRINIRAEFNLTINGESHRKTINATIERV